MAAPARVRRGGCIDAVLGGQRRSRPSASQVLGTASSVRRGRAARDPAVHVLGHTERERGRGARPRSTRRREDRTAARCHAYWPRQAPMARGGPVTVRPARWAHRELLAASGGPAVTSILDGTRRPASSIRSVRTGIPRCFDGGPRRAALSHSRTRSGSDAPRALGEPVEELKRAVWYPAIGDGAAGSVGSGCTDRTRVAINVGTSSAMRLVTDGPRAAPPWGLWRYRLDARRSVAGGSLSEGGDVYAWCTDTLDLGEPDAIEGPLIAHADTEHGSRCSFLAGERSPAGARGLGAPSRGLSLATRRDRRLRASLESVALRLALSTISWPAQRAEPRDRRLRRRASPASAWSR